MDVSTQILLAVLIAMLSYPILRVLVRRQRADVFAPLSMFSFCLLYGYLYSLPRFLERTDTFSVTLVNEFNHFANSLRMAVVMVILGVIGMHLGYRRGQRHRTGNSLKEAYQLLRFSRALWDTHRLRRVSLIYSVIGVVVFGIGIALLGGPSVIIHGLGDRLRLFEGLYYFVLPANLLLVVSLAWWTYLLSSGQKLGIGFWIYTFSSVLICSLQGNKSTLFVFILTLAIVYHYLRRRLSLKYVGIGGLALVILMTFYALVAREYLVAGVFQTVDFKEAPARLVIDAVDRALEAESFQLQMLTFLIDRMPENLEFQYGKTLLPLLTTPIPRTLWPGKPITVPGTIAMAYWPDEWLDSGTTHPPGLLGEFYINLGGPGCFLGMMGFGYLYARFRGSALQSSSHPLQVTRYAVLLALIPHYVRGEFVSPTIMYATFALPLWVFQRLALVERKYLG